SGTLRTAEMPNIKAKFRKYSWNDRSSTIPTVIGSNCCSTAGMLPPCFSDSMGYEAAYSNRGPLPNQRGPLALQLCDHGVRLLELQASRSRGAGRTAGGSPTVVGLHYFHNFVLALPGFHETRDTIPHGLEIGSKLDDIIFVGNRSMAGNDRIE